MTESVRDVLVDPSLTVFEALQTLSRTGKRVLFLVKDGCLTGALADGDIRRFLLKGGTLQSSVTEAANDHPHFVLTTERRHAESIIWEKDISAIPVVDDDWRVVDVVFRHDVVNLDDVSIRPLVPSDLQMVLDFFDQMAGDTRAMFDRGDVNRLRAIGHLKRTEEDHQIHFAAVVRDSSGVELMVGYVFLWDTDWKIPWLGIAVREDWKGHHLGRRLLDYLDAWAKPKGYGGLMLTSVPANIRAHALYERMGFEHLGVYLDGEYLYAKRYRT